MGDLADALNYAAVKLFMNSAIRALPTFDLTQDNLDHVARICRLVQGMPLGIVLAASWLAMLSPKEIVEEMQQSMDILEDEVGQVPERQRSIRAVMDYSWNLINEKEQQSFMKMSVFRGGFTREAVQEIANANLRLLMSLTTKSLIRRDVDTGRYTIHELLRQYALEKLQQSGQEAETRAAHSRYFLDYGSHWSSQLIRNQLTASANLIADHDNIVEAWHNAIKQHDEVAIESGLMLYIYYNIQIHFNLAEAIFEKALEVVSHDNQLLMTILKVLIVAFRTQQGRITETEIAYVQEGLATLKDTKYQEFYILAKFLQAYVLRATQGLDAWAGVLSEVQDLARKFHSDYNLMNATGLLSYYETLKGSYDEVEQMVIGVIPELRRNQNIGEIAYRYAMIAEISLWRGDYEQARQRFEDAMVASLKIRMAQKIVDINVLLGLISFFETDYTQVQYHLNQISALAERLGLSYSSIKDGYAIKVRLNLAQNHSTVARKDLLKLLKFGSSTSMFVDFTAIAAADWLIYHGQPERVVQLLHYIRHADVPPAVRKCAQLLLETLPEQDDDINTDNFQLKPFWEELEAELEN